MREGEHPAEDLLLDVALGGADDRDRERVGEHLSGCPRCRRSQEDLMEGTDLALPAVPRTAPPPGFETTVLDRLRQEQSNQSPQNPDRPGRFRWLALAAAILLGVAVGGTGIQIFGDGLEQEPPAATTWDAPLVTDDGDEVGGISRGYGTSGSQLVVTLSEATAGSTYLCRAVLADGTVRDLGQWQASDEYDDVWIIDEPAQDVQTVQLLDETGDVWATATL